jgi:signal transduction histidine kinase
MRFLRRYRLPLLWVLLALAASAATLVFHRLYATARDEIAAQAASVVAQEKARAIDLVTRYAEEVRRTTVAELAAFHVDGLERALRRWDEANEVVVATFVWDPQRGPASVVAPNGALSAAELQTLVQRLRDWRSAHPAGEPPPPFPAGTFRTAAYHLLGNPEFAEATLGYQGENLDLLAQSGRAVDPWAGWASNVADPAAPWAFWYQPGPGAPVRGCFVAVAPLVERLRAELAAGGKARVVLEPWISPSADHGQVGAGLPAYRLVVAPGEILRTKAGATRLAGVVGALLLGLFLGVGALLTLQTRRSAREAERRITFVAQVSHELRTPLTSIRMFADLLAASQLEEPKRLRFAGRIADESRRLGALIERLLAFNALEKGTRKIERAPVEVAAVVNEVAEEMLGALAAAGLTLNVATLGEAELPHAWTERSTVKQALINLLDNAVKYAAGSGEITVTLAADMDRLRVRVADRGPGIPAEIRGRVFEPFVQGGRTLTDKSPGVGLGLSIARGLLRQTGGDLLLLDAAAGATFEIRLPLATAGIPVSPT